MAVAETLVNHAKRVPHPDPKLRKQGATVPASVFPEWRPIRRLVCRAFVADEDMQIPSDAHGMQHVDAGDVVLQDELGNIHKLTPEQFALQFNWAEAPPDFATAPPPSALPRSVTKQSAAPTRTPPSGDAKQSAGEGTE
ncbi:MAG TPA: hypothetical protein VES65_11385 [Solirubrobacteraceae bacterium]|nr:hypothetical protein [Solirubrobacteraceae bacterium]